MTEGNNKNFGDSKQLGDQILVISNVCKLNNIKHLFNIAKCYSFDVVLVGITGIKQTMENYDVEFLYFEDLVECKRYLQERRIPLIGIEIVPNAKSVLEFSFSNKIALMPGNEGTGLTSRQKELSDFFVYIPQYGKGTASLNVYIATTIVLYHFNLSQKA